MFLQSEAHKGNPITNLRETRLESIENPSEIESKPFGNPLEIYWKSLQNVKETF